MEAAVTPPGNDSTCQAIELALSVLESSPKEYLPQYLDRLQNLADIAKGSVQIYNAVFSNDELLGKILEFDGSLAFYHKAYDNIVGYESPLPYDWSSKDNVMPGSSRRLCDLIAHYRDRVTISNGLVNKKWQSMVMGKEGLQKWKYQSEEKVKKDISIAIKASADETLSWTARICAMAIANDVAGLKRVFETSDDFNKALWEQENKDDDSYSQYDDSFEPVPRDHPFYWLCKYRMVEEDDDTHHVFVVSIAYAAALVGSIDALSYLQSLAGGPLCCEHFDQKGDGFLKSLVVEACYNPTLDCIVKSIATIFPAGNSYLQCRLVSDSIHWRHRGGNCNNLHLAAGRGHQELVRVLIEGGMNPNRRCERICKRRSSYERYHYDSDDSNADSIEDERDRGVDEYPLPQHWASIRGHEEVAQFIDLHSDGGGVTDGTKEGKVKCFNTERGFGFITPDDYDSDDVFVHITNVDDNVPLERGQTVQFTSEVTSRGLQAVNVTRVQRRGYL